MTLNTLIVVQYIFMILRHVETIHAYFGSVIYFLIDLTQKQMDFSSLIIHCSIMINHMHKI